MRITLRFRKHRFGFSHYTVTDVTGVNSKVDDDLHICMWDFDNQPLESIIDALLLVQHHYCLPRIFILRTNEKSNYQAFSLTRRPFKAVVVIIIETFLVDWNFWKLGVLRGFFTLRTSPKFNCKPKLVKVLQSKYMDECTLRQLKCWTRYETVDDRGNAQNGREKEN